ncbi:hypothetical protein [Candidatus Poriferisodalis sp.]
MRIEDAAEAERQRSIDRALVEGYRRQPPTVIEDTAAVDALRRSIAEEPW